MYNYYTLKLLHGGASLINDSTIYNCSRYVEAFVQQAKVCLFADFNRADTLILVYYPCRSGGRGVVQSLCHCLL